MVFLPIIALAFSLAPALQERDRQDLVFGEVGAEVDQYLESCEALGFSGVVLVQKNHQVIVRKGYGMARWDLELPNTPETLYDIASASKQVTAAAILLLESRGEIDTSKSIAEYLPGVPKEHKSVTVYHLLTHTSGFPRFGPGGGGPDLEAALEGYFSGKRNGKSGKKFEYYNGGYAMLAGIVEQVTGETFEDWVQGNLFVPAGVHYTDFIETDRLDHDLLSEQHNTNRLTNRYIKGWGYKGMGGVLTSVSDLAIWCTALFDGKVLPPNSLQKMITPYKENYGCGWYILESPGGRKVIQHGGTAQGFQSYIRYFMEDDLLILVMTNQPGWHWQVAWEIPGIILEEKVETPALPIPVLMTSKRNEAYCGIWESKGERLIIEAQELGFSINGAGALVNLALAGMKQGKDVGDRPKPAEMEALEKRTMHIIQSLRDGDAGPLAEKLGPRVPEIWTGHVLDLYLPKHISRWGKIESQELLASYYNSATGRVHVWVRLHQEKGTRSFETTYLQGDLMTFDLNSRPYPFMTSMVPLEDGSLTSFDYQDKPPCTLTLKGKGKSRTLELKSRSGKKMKFRLVE